MDFPRPPAHCTPTTRIAAVIEAAFPAGSRGSSASALLAQAQALSGQIDLALATGSEILAVELTDPGAIELLRRLRGTTHELAPDE